MGNNVNGVGSSGSVLQELTVKDNNKSNKNNENELEQVKPVLTSDTTSSTKVSTGKVPANDIKLDSVNVNEEEDFGIIINDELENFQRERDEKIKQQENKEKPHFQKRIMALVNKSFPASLVKGATGLVVKSAVKSEAKAALSLAVKSASGAVVEGTAKAVIKEGSEAGVKNALKLLTEGGRLGKGLATVSVKEARSVFGKFFNPVAYGKAFAESAKGAQKVVTSEIAEKGVAKGLSSIASKTGVGATEKVLQEGIEKGIASAAKSVAKSSGKTLAKESLEGAASKAATEAAIKASEKTSVKVASRIAAAAPFISAAIGTGITVWDAKHAYELSKTDASTASKALAWSTVGLDVVSTATIATGVGAPIGWAATALSIGTSVASEVLK